MNNSCVDLLGFDLNVFLDGVAAGGSTESAVFPDLTEEEYLQLKMRGSKFLIKIDACGSFIQCPTRAHSSVSSAIAFWICSFNTTRTDNENMPMLEHRSADMNVNGRLHQPNLQTQVVNRTHDTPNFVVETHYRSSMNMAQFHQRVRNLILQSPSIMLVLAVKIYEHDAHGHFGAIALLYERGVDNQPHITQNISFGTGAVSVTDRAAWAAATADFPLVGVGMDGDVPCTLENVNATPYVLHLRQDMLLCKNTNAPFEYNEGDEPTGEHHDLPLFYIQRWVMQSFLL